MTAPITPDERAAMRERYAANLPSAWATSAAAHGRALRYLGASAREDVPRLLDALDTAEARQNAALGRLKTAKDEVRRVDNFLRLEREAARENLARAEKAEAEVARLREEAARPAPVWDEDTVTEAVARAMFPHYFTDDRQPLRVFTETRSDTELREAEREAARHRARQALAVVREHLPVFAADIDGLAFAIFEHSHEPSLPDDQGGVEEARSRALDYIQMYVEQGESRATVQAEALRAFAKSIESEAQGLLDAPDFELLRDRLGRVSGLRIAARLAHTRADRLDPKGA